MTGLAQAGNQTSDPDAELVRQAQTGDTAAFESLYRRHNSRVYALCWRLAGASESLAEELVQQCFVRAWEKLGTFKYKSRFTTWLHRLSINQALSDKRIRVRRVQREVPLDEHYQPAQPAQSNNGLLRDLERAIASLPERARTVLVLYDIEGYQHNEIAEITGMAVGSSKAQLHRARKMLREVL